MTIQKPDFNQIFASQAPDVDKPPVFNNYNGGWGNESRPNNGKPTIKGFNYLQQLTDTKLLWLKQNAVLPYDSDTDYPIGTVTLKDGKFQKWDGAEWADFIKANDSQITTWSGRTQEQENKAFITSTTADNIGSLATEIGRTAYVKGLGLYSFNGVKWEKEVQFTDWLNPKNYGVKGDGSTSDTVAINAFFREVERLGGGYVYFPEGIYCHAGIDGTIYDKYLVLPRNTPMVVVCHPNAMFLKKAGYSFISTDYTETETYERYGDWVRDLNWFGGTFDMNLDEVSGGEIVGIVAGENISFTGTKFILGVGYHALDINSSKKVMIDGCTFIVRDKMLDGAQIKEIIQISHFRQAELTLGCDDVTVQNCRLVSEDGSNVGAQVGIGDHWATATIYNTNIRILNNYIENTSSWGINIYKHNDIIISGNTFKNCYCPIHNTQTGLAPTSSQYPDNTPSGLNQTARDITISENLFINSKFADIYFDVGNVEAYVYSENVKIINNTSTMEEYNTGGGSMILFWLKDSHISGNKCKNTRRLIYSGQWMNVEVINNKQDGGLEGWWHQDSNNTHGFTGVDYNRDIFFNNNHFKNIDGAIARTRTSINYLEYIGNTGRNIGRTGTALYVPNSFNSVIGGRIERNGIKQDTPVVNYVRSVITLDINCESVIVKDNDGYGVTTNIGSENNSATSYTIEYGTVNPENVAYTTFGEYTNVRTGIKYYRRSATAGRTGWTTT